MVKNIFQNPRPEHSGIESISWAYLYSAKTCKVVPPAWFYHYEFNFSIRPRVLRLWKITYNGFSVKCDANCPLNSHPKQQKQILNVLLNIGSGWKERGLWEKRATKKMVQPLQEVETTHLWALCVHTHKPGSQHTVSETLANWPGLNIFWNWRH